MINLSKITIVLLAIFCNIAYAQTIEGNGNVISKTITAEDFNKLEIHIGANVTINESNDNSIIVTGDSNIIDSVNFRYGISDTLFVEFIDNSNYQYESLEITFNISDINYYSNSASGQTSINEFENATSLLLINGGSSSFEIAAFPSSTYLVLFNGGSGNCTFTDDWPNIEYFLLNNTGSGTISACKINADSCQVNNLSSGFTSVRTQLQLKAIIYGSGGIDYYGEGTIISTLLGSGVLQEGSDLDCELSTDIEFINHEYNISIFPNPSLNGFTINSNNETIKKLEFYNSSGTKIHESYPNQKTYTSKLNIPKGLYFVRIKTTNSITTKQLVVEQ